MTIVYFCNYNSNSHRVYKLTFHRSWQTKYLNYCLFLFNATIGTSRTYFTHWTCLSIFNNLSTQHHLLLCMPLHMQTLQLQNSAHTDPNYSEFATHGDLIGFRIHHTLTSITQSSQHMQTSLASDSVHTGLNQADPQHLQTSLASAFSTHWHQLRRIRNTCRPHYLLHSAHAGSIHAEPATHTDLINFRIHRT